MALPESADDVIQVVELARRHGLQIAPQGTGHNASALGGALEDTILLKTQRMRGVTIDPEARIARAEAGVIWSEVVEAAAEHGLAALAGSSPDVGVVGYTLGGGLSWLARKRPWARARWPWSSSTASSRSGEADPLPGARLTAGSQQRVPPWPGVG